MESTVENSTQDPELQASASTESDTAAEVYLDQALWTRLGDAASGEAFAGAWLDLQSRMITGARRAVVVLGAADKGPYTPVAFWPDETDVSLELSAVAEMAMAERKVSVRRSQKTALALLKKLENQKKDSCPLQLQNWVER